MPFTKFLLLRVMRLVSQGVSAGHPSLPLSLLSQDRCSPTLATYFVSGIYVSGSLGFAFGCLAMGSITWIMLYCGEMTLVVV